MTSSWLKIQPPNVHQQIIVSAPGFWHDTDFGLYHRSSLTITLLSLPDQGASPKPTTVWRDVMFTRLLAILWLYKSRLWSTHGCISQWVRVCISIVEFAWYATASIPLVFKYFVMASNSVLLQNELDCSGQKCMGNTISIIVLKIVAPHNK